jgi:uncharacterized DUF497 family protein
MHDVSQEEAEYVILHDPLDLEIQTGGDEERFVQIGATNLGRILRVVTTFRGAFVRAVTAYDAPRRDRLRDESWRMNIYGAEA